MKYIFFPTSDGEFANVADCAKIRALLGADVTIVLCNENVCHCWHNMQRNRGLCFLCKRQIKWFVSHMPSSVKLISIDDYADENVLKRIQTLSFEYNSVDDIKKICFDGVNIGYGCLSSYVTITRNLNPLIDDEFKVYFDSFLRSTCYLTHCQKAILLREKPDHIYLFNGRFSHVRPLVELAKSLDIEFTCTEGTYSYEGKIYQNNFENTMPHSIEVNTKLMENAWKDISVSQSEKEWLGNLFYQSKVNCSFTGDTNYTSGQSLGLLPKGWDNTKKNYVIFNSSEDEFFSIGDEYDKKKVFDSQIDGISYIAEKLQDRDDVHVYLRIHPNLKDIKYKYHTDLLKLGEKYRNLTVIPGDSPISSYSLINVSDRIVVFGSTIGAESAYAGKPVINLAGAPYSGLAITYNPETPEQLFPLLQKEILPNKANRCHLLMFGYYYMYIRRPRTVFFDQDIISKKHFGKLLRYQNHQNIYGSHLLYYVFVILVRRFFAKVSIPFTEA